MSEPLQPSPVDRSVKIPHLVFGLLFLGVAVIWALAVTGVITEDRLPVLAPALLIVAGIVGLTASLASTRNRRQRQLDAEQHFHDAAEAQREPHLEPDPAHDRSPVRANDDEHTQEIR